MLVDAAWTLPALSAAVAKIVCVPSKSEMGEDLEKPLSVMSSVCIPEVTSVAATATVALRYQAPLNKPVVLNEIMGLTLSTLTVKEDVY